MKYDRRHKSDNVEYRGRAGGFPGGFGGAAAGAGGLGIIGLIIALLFGGGGAGGFDLSNVGLDAGRGGTTATPPTDIEPNTFLEFTFDTVQDTWTEIFDAAGSTYTPSRMVIFQDSVNTAGCGSATAAVGPFYCPADQLVYLDQSFFDQLEGRFGAPGDFAQAYVVAHEVGHHVQKLIGVSDEVTRLSRQDPSQRNELSIRQELQADCFAGVWAHDAEQQGLLERGDVEEALAAASGVGDDSIQSGAGMSVNPESFTHGSSRQRQEWFERGFERGDVGRCDAFAVSGSFIEDAANER